MTVQKETKMLCYCDWVEMLCVAQVTHELEAIKGFKNGITEEDIQQREQIQV